MKHKIKAFFLYILFGIKKDDRMMKDYLGLTQQ